MTSRFVYFDERETWTEALASAVVDLLDDAIARRRVARLALAGGGTPRPVYGRLAARYHDWTKVHLFWGDERCVPPDDPRSNYALARETLLDAIDVPPANIHRIRGEMRPDAAAASYEEVLRNELPRDAAGWPVFDGILLGMGGDGHTASLLPGDPTLEETSRWTAVARGEHASPPVPRVTLTLPALNAARSVLFAVAGPAKLDVVSAIETHAETATRYPASRVRPATGATWYVCRN